MCTLNLCLHIADLNALYLDAIKCVRLKLYQMIYETKYVKS